MAAGRTLNSSCMVGMDGNLEKPRRRAALALASPWRTSATSSRKRLTTAEALAASGVSGVVGQRGLALLLRVGVGERVGQPFGREAGDEAVLLAREDADLDALALGQAGVEIGADADVLLGRDAARPGGP